MNAPDPSPRDLVHQVPALVAVYDLHSRAVHANDALQPFLAGARLVGHRPEDLVGFDDTGRSALAAMLQRVLATGETMVGDVTAALADGQRRLFMVRVHGQQDAQGVVRHAVLVGLDVTEAIGLRERLSQASRPTGLSAESLPQNIIRYDLTGRATYVNRELGERYKIRTGSVIGRRPSEAAPVGAPGMLAYERALDRVLATGNPDSVELPAMARTGELRVHCIELSAERDAEGSITGAVAVGRDITEQVQAREALARKEREFRSLAENAGDVIIRWDIQAVTLYANPALQRLFPRAGDRFVGRRPTELAHLNPGPMHSLEERVRQVAAQAQPSLMELRFKDPESERLQVHELRIVPEFDADGQVSSVLGIGRDITEKIAHMELIESLLHVDSLTQLANRQALRERTARLLSAARRRGRCLGLLLLDLDQFKAINDGLGHSAGDELLVEVARRLGTCARTEDVLARLGGDEFVIVAADVDGADAVMALAERLHAELSAPIRVAGRDVGITLSVGMALFPDDGATLEELLANADSAMYEAKRTGRGRTRAYTSTMGEAARRRLALEQALRSAPQRGELVVHYQPKVDLSDPTRVVGAEALVRWQHPDMGLLMPDMFVPLAEESGLIVDLGRWVLREAMRAVTRWNATAPSPLHVAVNVSPRQFRDRDFPDDVARALAETGCDPRWLWLEITEGALVSDPTCLEQALSELRCVGVRVSVDDFGTGYSALNYLVRFPIDQMKIDKSFVHSIGRSHRDDELIKAFLAIGAALGLEVVAEGVETDAQTAHLLRLGCTQAQGYRFGRPMAEAGFVQRLDVHTAVR